jgi:hypothetical protein
MIRMRTEWRLLVARVSAWPFFVATLCLALTALAAANLQGTIRQSLNPGIIALKYERASLLDAQHSVECKNASLKTIDSALKHLQRARSALLSKTDMYRQAGVLALALGLVSLLFKPRLLGVLGSLIGLLAAATAMMIVD